MITSTKLTWKKSRLVSYNKNTDSIYYELEKNNVERNPTEDLLFVARTLRLTVNDFIT